jgi:hypothetical protein
VTDDEKIAEFFEVFDERVKSPRLAHLAEWRPLLERLARNDPRGFVQTMDDFIEERMRGWR